ncbi:hypothetical protein [Flagellimonas sp.]|jgi:hypothetical protein|uniref:hypothetical protein n=1 Tax=Flagellimonas sp. TaxID=2058762 RepID=UPI000C08DD44|nr:MULTISPECIES: hypothetical protein [unclassified Allomuricauda]MAU14151.1 hypothetical protein [Allomuricauda sp.]|tara:strand:+ start:198 stop:572 length:375 start_codon:yes stop_codon:yes gene_type:complete
MKPKIPDSYPAGLENEEIQKIISDCTQRVSRMTRPNVNVSLGANFFISMIQLGQSELNNRIQSDLLQLIEQQGKETRKTQTINWLLTGLTILLAIITLYIGNKSLGFAESDQLSDEEWRMQQID